MMKKCQNFTHNFRMFRYGFLIAKHIRARIHGISAPAPQAFSIWPEQHVCWPAVAESALRHVNVQYTGKQCRRSDINCMRISNSHKWQIFAEQYLDNEARPLLGRIWQLRSVDECSYAPRCPSHPVGINDHSDTHLQISTYSIHPSMYLSGLHTLFRLVRV